MSPDVSARLLPFPETKAMFCPSGDHVGREDALRVSDRRRPSTFMSSTLPVVLLSNAILLPSGDHAGSASSPDRGVSRRRTLPSALMTSITVLSRLPVKAMLRPSGDQVGYESMKRSRVSCRRPLPSG